jgi:hypothetical protein
MPEVTFGTYKNITPFHVYVKLPGNDVATVPAGKTVVFVDSYPGVKEMVAQGKLVRTGNASSQEVTIIVEK